MFRIFLLLFCFSLSAKDTVSNSSIGICQGGAQNLGQAPGSPKMHHLWGGMPSPKQLNLESLAMEVDPKVCGCPTQAEPILESRAVDTVCLNMIVKNEKDVIRRCLDSVIPVIDYWVIVDTGSTDGTQKILLEHLKGIPGELHERPWKNFEHNRNEALDLARGKEAYILFMDADDVLEFDGPVQFPPLTADQYTMWRGPKSFSYLKPQLVKDELPWKWVGVTHEYLGCDTHYNSEVLPSVHYTTCEGGADGKDVRKKFLRDVQLLEAGLKEEPDNGRYAFYLAQSYRDLGEFGKAIEWFQKRIKIGGWSEEIFLSKLRIGLTLRDIGLPHTVVSEALLDAFKYRPHRAETVYYLADVYNQARNYVKAYEFLKVWEYIPKPEHKDSLFNEDWIEQYGLLFQLSIASYYLGHYEESLKACDKLLTIPDLPDSWRAQTFVNRTYPMAKLENKELGITVKVFTPESISQSE